MEGAVNYNTSYVHKYVLPFDVFQITSFPVKPHLHAHVNNSCVFLHSAFFLRGVFLAPRYFRPSTPANGFAPSYIRQTRLCTKT